MARPGDLPSTQVSHLYLSPPRKCLLWTLEAAGSAGGKVENALNALGPVGPVRAVDAGRACTLHTGRGSPASRVTT